MPDRAKTSELEAVSAFADRFPQQYGTALVMMSQACQGYMEGALKLNQEMANFVRRRLEQDVSFGQKLSSAEHVEDAVSLQQDWMKTASSDYLAETTKLYGICMEAASNGWMNGVAKAGGESAGDKPAHKPSES